MRTVKDNIVDFEQYASLPREAEKVRPASDWTQKVIDRVHLGVDQRGNTLPWSKTHNLVRVRPYELSIWSGYNGSGKSMILNHVLYDLLQQGEKALICSMEMLPEATMERMTRQACGLRDPSPDYIRAFNQWTNDRLWIFDHHDAIKAERMMCIANYAHVELGINHLVIDSLMRCDMGVDDYNKQKKFVSELCNYAKNTGVHVHLVAHSRKGDSEKKRVDKMDIKGASEITDQADNVFILWRNKPKEEAVQKNPNCDQAQDYDAILSCVKQRHGEWEGNIALWFDKPSMQYVAYDQAKPIKVFDWSQFGHG